MVATNESWNDQEVGEKICEFYRDNNQLIYALMTADITTQIVRQSLPRLVAETASTTAEIVRNKIPRLAAEFARRNEDEDMPKTSYDNLYESFCEVLLSDEVAQFEQDYVDHVWKLCESSLVETFVPQTKENILQQKIQEFHRE
jgi:hypothetical protein